MTWKTILLLLYLIASTHLQGTDPIDITPEGSPVKNPDIQYIPIFHTTDLHGFFYPLEVRSETKPYTRGGLEYLAKYLSILREKWDDVLWFDAGDQFQGSIENKVSNGEIMTSFFNTMGLNIAGVGNHEFDFGQDFLISRLNAAQSFKYYAANLGISAEKKELFKNLGRTVKIEIGDIRLGIVGLTSVNTPQTSSGDLKGITFKSSVDTVKAVVQELRKDTHAVLLVAHFGIECPNNTDDRDILKVRTKETVQKECDKNDELYDLLTALPPDTVDAVLAGHKHENIHYWINGVPSIANKNQGLNASILYLAFDPVTKKLLKEKILLEGPLPVCEKVFEKTLNCHLFEGEDLEKAGALVNFKYKGVEIAKEPKLKESADLWLPKIQEYKTKVIGRTNGLLEVSKDKEVPFNNLVTNMLLSITGADVSILNKGSFRTAWSKGVITGADLYEMSPFDATIVTVKVTGEELIRMVKEIQRGLYKYYLIGGLMQVLKESSGQIISMKLFKGLKEKPINPKETYLLATINYNIPFGGDDFSNVLKWYKPREFKEWEGEFRDVHFAKYLGAIPEIKVERLIDPYHPRFRTIE